MNNRRPGIEQQAAKILEENPGMDPMIALDTAKEQYTPDTTPDWTKKCENCDQSPIVPFTGLCGPCTFGEADTAGGNW